MTTKPPKATYYATHKAERAAYYQAHRAELAAYQKAYYQTHRTKYAAYQRTYQRVHRADYADYYEAYRKGHRAEAAKYRQARKAEAAARMKMYRKTHRVELAAYQKAYTEAHIDEHNDRGARRRALVRGADVEKVSRAVVYKRDGGRCHICGKKVPKKGWHLDHLIPLKRGGEHSYKNVAVACPKCNLSKGTKAVAQLRLL